VIKLQSCSNAASIGPKCIKLEPKTPNITIIQTSKPITLANMPVITMTTPSVKRRRADSPVNQPQTIEKPTLTINELKRQYGNMSVNNQIDFRLVLVWVFLLGGSIEETSSND
jgi:hypothetical protein